MKVSLKSKRVEDEHTLEGKRRAIIVGINKYKDPNIAKLDGAENDAKEICELLKKPEIGNFEILPDHFLLGEKATCENIRKAISDVFWKTDACDLTLFYFSGHGFEDSYHDGYIAPYDITKSEPFVFGINMEQLKQVISRSVSESALVILDCCHSGIATEPDKSIDDVTKEISKHFNDFPGKGRFILASSEGTQTSKEISQLHWNKAEIHPHGTFSFYLIEGMNGEASDENGIINLARLFKYAADKTEKGGKQKPKSSAVDAGPLDRIEIAISTQKYNTYLKNLIEEAKVELNRGDTNIIYSVEKISDVLKRDAKNDEANVLKNKICETLNKEQESVYFWFIQNTLDIQHDIEHLRSEFEKIIERMAFDGITTLTRRERLLLVPLFDASKGKIDIKQFIKKCITIDKSTLQTGAKP